MNSTKTDTNEPIDELTNKQESNEQTANSTEEVIDDKKKIEALSNQISELNDKYLRLYSEYDNYRKRSSKERLELMKTAGEDILIGFLTIMDDFERAIKSNETAQDIKAVNEGVALIYNKLKNILLQKGVEPLTSVGTEFNADIHEAITNVPAPSADLKGKIIDEVEKGYSMNGKVIRFAKVIVGN